MYRPKTTLEQWRILQAVVDNGGYAHAAAALNKSQSSLNHAVAKLQNQLGVQLLEVRGRKAFLTEAGEVMLRRSRHLTQNVQELESLADNINQDWEPEITVALDLAYPKSHFYPVLKDFLPESRGSRLKLIDTVLTGTEEAVTQGWADIVIGGSVPKGYLGEPIAEVSFVAVSSPDHPLAQLDGPIEASELLQHLQLVIKDTSQTPNEKQGWLKSELRWTVSHFQTAIELVMQNMGFCWLPYHTVESHIESGQLVPLDIQGSSFRITNMFMIHPRPDTLGPGSRHLSDLILSHRQITPLNEQIEQQNNEASHGDDPRRT
ncbi:putative RuBisCO transcriptional regulator [Saliniradius amylolyticus]|uniref:Putative RuBisCO transcriptional regulator n=1 Tax=Saliniradius amylolyticus TaxID=2183582 RepID=A0A2S2E4M6_9ALTE|nr:LysR family transcriptional regulator [Saliniradius amylolyticus]AWL12200.1 putative RuBisCO transcriptional regulator [Saliniradius amylolyticus]